MKICPNCGNAVDEGVAFCRNCGFNLGNAGAQYQQAQYQQYQQPAYDPTDHTAEFSAEEVSKNKLYAALPYFLGAIGIVIVLLINQKEESAYLLFHVKQGIKIILLSTIAALIPFVGWIAAVVLLVVSLICGFTTLGGKSKEPPIISSFDFLK